MKFNKSPSFTLACIHVIENLQTYLDGKIFGRNIKINFNIVFEIEYIFLTIASEEYNRWDDLRQKEFLDMCSGARGVKILYDSFFKEIMNPEYAPERMNDMLSILLNKKVKIKEVLPLDSTRMGDERSLIIMDIVVELEDGSIADVEVQKIGYAFPGQRMACYSADMLLRQYKRLRDVKKKEFSYRDIGKVYTIIFFENSPKELQDYKDVYIHRGKQVFDTGLELNMLQEYVLIPLDIFNKIKENKGINNKLEAWLTFLGTDSPEKIEKLISRYPEYIPMYKDIYELCLNTERVMWMYSKELAELDKNTMGYMVDQMQNEINRQNKELEEKDKKLKEQDDRLKEQDSKLKEQDKSLEEFKGIVKEQNKALDEYKKVLETLNKRILELENK